MLAAQCEARPAGPGAQQRHGLCSTAAMVRWAILSFVVAVMSVLVGFDGISSGAVVVGKMLFTSALVVVAVGAVGWASRSLSGAPAGAGAERLRANVPPYPTRGRTRK